MTALPTHFRFAYEAEVGLLLVRRFRMWVIVWLLLWLLVRGLSGFTLELLLCGALIGVTGWYGMRRVANPEELSRLAGWMLIGASSLSMALAALNQTDATLGWAFFWTGLWHLSACLLLPLSAWQAARPAIACIIVWFVLIVWFGTRELSFATPIEVVFASLIYWPGVLICGFRMTRFGRRFEARMLREHQQEFSREVFDAQRFHEALFPKPTLEGPLQFRYIDLPRAGIGGDFLHAAFDGRGRLNIVLLDVSGDGISAALTVHRLQGELERIAAESTDGSVAPDEALRSLDRYVRLTLAPHGIYAFAIAFRIDVDGTFEWSGAGHTPAFIRRGADGSTMRLESTTWPLGASDTPDPLQCLMTTRLEPNDTLIAHTDGACEEMDPHGKRISYSGVEDLIRNAVAPEDTFRWPERFIDRLGRFRGNGESLYDVRREDMLVVAVRREATG